MGNNMAVYLTDVGRRSVLFWDALRQTAANDQASDGIRLSEPLRQINVPFRGGDESMRARETLPWTLVRLFITKPQHLSGRASSGLRCPGW
jgi:hypothetical protein